ncbi:unnamed protein product, partial [Adineta steineri]
NGFFDPPTIYIAEFKYEVLFIDDLNNDKKPDFILAQSKDYKISIYYNVDNGMFPNVRIFPANGDPFVLKPIDINGDGKMEIIVSCYDGKAYAYIGLLTILC